MKMIATTFTWCFLLYMCAYVLLHLKYTPPADFPKPRRDSASLGEMKTHPSKYDGSFFSDTLIVKHPGDPLLDLFNIHTFQAADRHGAEIPVYQGSAISNPDKGSVIVLTGMFRLLENDTYSVELCLFAQNIEFLNPDDPAVKRFVQGLPEKPAPVKADFH